MLFRILGLLILVSPPFSASAASDHELAFEFAYRNSANANEFERRAVILQGSRDSGATRIDKECGATGAHCNCLFYRSASDSNPMQSAGSGFSAAHHTFSCTIPGAQNQLDSIRFAALRKRDGQLLSRMIPVKTTIQLEHVLGHSLEKSKVRGIFRYSCSRTFFEGEGVSPTQIMCMPGQRLGVLNASYNFYTFRSGEDSNSPGGDSAFSDSICGRNSFLKIQCTGNTPELRYGLYKESNGPFVVGITLTRAPEGDNLTQSYGFAALPDSAGVCAPGLVKVRPWVAQPASITEGSIDGANPASNFINSNHTLSNTVVEPGQPINFSVTRQKSLVPCTGDGNCSNAEFGSLEQVQSVSYVGLTPVVCAIPANLLNGLF